MPLYAFQCPNGHSLELARSVADRDTPVVCERCPRGKYDSSTYGHPVMKRVPTLASPVFPGADRWR